MLLRQKDLVDTYALDADDYAEELGEVQDTLEADNYEDQLPQPEVIYLIFFLFNLVSSSFIFTMLLTFLVLLFFFRHYFIFFSVTPRFESIFFLRK